MILNQLQAKAVYDAMCALNNVNIFLSAQLSNNDDTTTYVLQYSFGTIKIGRMARTGDIEREVYTGQAHFVLAYNLDRLPTNGEEACS